VECPYCHKKFYAKLQRHLLSVHKQIVKSKCQADAICKGLKKIPKEQPANDTMEKIWGEKLKDPEILQLVKQTVLASGMKWQDDDDEDEAPASQAVAGSDNDDSSSSSESDSDADDGRVRQKKKEMGLNARVPEGHIVLKEFEKALKKDTSSADSIKKTLDRMAQYLAFAEKEDPDKVNYLAVVNIVAAKEYLQRNKRAGVKSATRLTYVKCLLKVLVRDNKLAKGECVIANLTHCFEYPGDEDVKKARLDLSRIKSFALLRSPLVFKRGDVSDVLAFNSITRYLMMSLILTNGGPRTGVLQNLKIEEFEAAMDDGHGNRVVQVRNHKTKDQGNASQVFNGKQHELVNEYLEVMKKISCARENRHRLFITTGGLPFRTPHYDINSWMKGKGYPDNISTNAIRKAMETAAANHSTVAQWAQRPTFLAKSQSRSLMHYKVKKGVVF